MGLRADWNQGKNLKTEIVQSEKEGEKSEKEKKKSTSPSDLWHNIQMSNMNIMGITKDRENETEKNSQK